ncbi:MAG: NADH-quinone oxidoreductase subunit J [Actinomycetota bacterium]|nr:NADH-quinone oxidoreductase subunit J [Actinomycetota bacterium]
MEFLVFVLAGAMVLGGAIGVVVRNHPVHAALSLVLTLFGIAVLFVAQEANFLAAVQVIVYAGAIVVLFLFVIMLLGVDKAEDLRLEPFKVQRPVAAIVGGGLLVLLGMAVIASRDATTAVKGGGLETTTDDLPLTAANRMHDGNIRALARDVFSDHVLAFELTSVLLVIAVVATVMLARKPRKGDFVVEGTGK